MAVLKKKKRVVITLLIILILLLAAVYGGYQLFFGSVDPDEKAAIDQEIDKVTQHILEGVQSGINPPESSLPEEEPGHETEDPTTGKNQQPGTGQEVNDPAQKNEAISNTTAVYENGFTKLQSEGNAIVDRLIAGIKADYKSAQASDASKLELAKLASSYTNRAKALESGIDSSVNILASKMKEDLQAAGMAEAEAQGYINRLKDEYKEQKDERRKLIVDKAKEYL